MGVLKNFIYTIISSKIYSFSDFKYYFIEINNNIFYHLYIYVIRSNFYLWPDKTRKIFSYFSFYVFRRNTSFIGILKKIYSSKNINLIFLFISLILFSFKSSNDKN